MEQVLRGQAAIVTGAGKLRGKLVFAIARALLSAGAQIAIYFRPTERIHQRARRAGPRLAST